ncbi:hypothetical protein [Paenibacillus turpanensis]|uniref:hypothetical protein n=1 Tax=Paenibacillus turpanensis TaxID=2689078 RepID=UPI00140ABBB0|nr:hypothetical protein [Paenibacillus turpanensis]
MRKKRTAILSGLISFCVLYAAVAFWIANDVKTVLRLGMQNTSNYSPYMTDEIYHKLHPRYRGMALNFEYDPAAYQQGPVLVLHCFFYAKAYTLHRYDSQTFGFHEPVQLSMQLHGVNWKAVHTYIRP